VAALHAAEQRLALHAPKGHAWQKAPLTPQADGELPGWQLPEASQQPRQLGAVQAVAQSWQVHAGDDAE
jgi:hypothetical protein